jgi:hypothetical protein
MLFVLVVLASTGRSAAQDYGPGDQVLTLGDVAFDQEGNRSFSYDIQDYYMYDEGLGMLINAPLSLPNGAEIFQMCLYAYVPDAFSSTSAQIFAAKLVPGGQAPHVQPIADSLVIDDVPIGYGVVCTSPFSYVFHDVEDIDSDGSPEPIFHFVEAHVGRRFGGVRIFWRRQVSPPPETPTFNDVPANDPYYQYVEALVASGITSGCATNPPRYCPDAPLTRRQMAVFLSKALGLHWPN